MIKTNTDNVEDNVFFFHNTHAESIWKYPHPYPMWASIARQLIESKRSFPFTKLSMCSSCSLVHRHPGNGKTERMFLCSSQYAFLCVGQMVFLCVRFISTCPFATQPLYNISAGHAAQDVAP